MGRKRVKKDRSLVGRKRGKKRANTIDRISRLPDDILVHIMSFLTLKEAVVTSVLSSRWSELWKQTPCLSFASPFGKNAQRSDTMSVKRRKYVAWVNGIIKKHKAATLKEFRIRFNLIESAEKHVNEWLRFAFAKHVKMLELDFSQRPGDNYQCQFKYCPFPKEFLTQNSGEASTSLPHSNSSGMDFKSLKVLSMKCVAVTCEDVKLLLQKFPLLEKLTVEETFGVSNLEVRGPSLVLKHLELICCQSVESVKVSAPNLTSLIVQNVEELLLENVPKLVDVSLDCWYGVLPRNKFPAISCCIPQLEILSLHLRAESEDIFPSTFPELSKLKKLVIIATVCNSKRSLMGLTSLIRASPNLHELVLKLRWRNSRSPVDREVKDSEKFAHQHLKVLKLCGFYGHANDLQLVRYIFKNCAVLEKVTIDPNYSLPSRVRPVPDKADLDRAAARIKAEVPQHIQLVVL